MSLPLLALAEWLSAQSDQALARLLRLREVPSEKIRDIFDLAEVLLDHDSIQLALEKLDRETLAFLAATIDSDLPQNYPLAVRENLESFALTDGGEKPYPWSPVVDVLRGWPAQGLPTLAELATTPAPSDIKTNSARQDTVNRIAGECAFHTLDLVGALLTDLGQEPARVRLDGEVTLTHRRRLRDSLGATDQQILSLLALAESAGLIQTENNTVIPLDAPWWQLSRRSRWVQLAEAWLAELAVPLHNYLRGRSNWDPLAFDWLYPAGKTWFPQLWEKTYLQAELLGLVVAMVRSESGETLLKDGAAVAGQVTAKLFPQEVSGLYLQPDFSVVAPGPLAPEVEERLRSFATAENGGLATHYRITQASLNRALTAGENLEKIREFLNNVSLSGLPQPIEYLLAETAERFGSFRVSGLDGDTLVQVKNSELLDQLLSDRQLSSLMLQNAGEHSAKSPQAVDEVYQTLLDARYPVVREEPQTRVVSAKEQSVDPFLELVARLRTGGEAKPGDWRNRQLKLAIAEKLSVLVSVEMPDGEELSYPLVPLAVGGGRLRAKEAHTGSEKTFPLARIIKIELPEVS